MFIFLRFVLLLLVLESLDEGRHVSVGASFSRLVAQTELSEQRSKLARLESHREHGHSLLELRTLDSS